MSFTLVIELALTGLLTATLGYCIVLERKLSQLRSGQDGLKATIGELNGAIAHAGQSMRALKTATGETVQTMDEKLTRARSLVDELSVLCASGTRIAERFERIPQQMPQAASRSVRPEGLEALRAVR